MRTKSAVLLSGVVVVATAVLSWSEDKPAQNVPDKSVKAQAPQTSPSAKVAPAADYPVIGSLEKRDRTIIIKAGPKGTLYTVKTADGRVLFENVSAEELRAQAPELHAIIKDAVAGGSGSGSKGSVDARVSPRADSSLR